MFGGAGSNRQVKQTRFKPTTAGANTAQSDEEANDQAYKLTQPVSKAQIGVLFEPVYKRMGHHFIPSSHKALIVIENEETPIVMGQPLVATSGISLLRAMKQGYLQHEIVEAQLAAFLRGFQGAEKLCMELDIFDLGANPQHLDNILDLITRAEKRGLAPKQITFELTASPTIDLAVLIHAVGQLKKLGSNVTLANMDADSFSFRRIFKVQPLAVKFNRTWSDEGREDENFQRMFKGIVDTLHSMGCYAGMTGVESVADLQYAQANGLTRCQGSYFGAPTTRLIRRQVYTV